jgi:ABC-type antimicrobial peptide transport system permease subunit
VPLLAGRYVSDDDMRRAERVCVVDEAFARQYWPEGEALGHRIRAMIERRTDMTIVGVAGTVKQVGLSETQPRGTVYRAITANEPPLWVAAVVRSELDSSTTLVDLRQTLAYVDPALVLENPQTMLKRVAENVRPQRAASMVAAFFSMAALLLAGVGIYGVLAFTIAQRQREIGIRIALGALPAQIRRYFVGLGLRMLLLGIAIGSAVAWMAGRAMRSMLFGVSPSDPVVFVLGILALGSVVWIATLLPSHRASRVSPLEALRHD